MHDWELLQEYAKHRSESAFAELVQRHLNWVYSSALRQVSDPHLAKDVTQSVFILLARKAGQLRSGTIVSGWLFRTTRFVASRALRGEYRRKAREQTASAMSTTASIDDSQIPWEQLRPHLDQAVATLPKTDRTAILLRFYERKTLREVGEQLGVSEDAAKKRVTRAVEKMRAFLTRRGVVLGGAGLVVLLAEQTVQAAPANLAIGIVKAATTSLSASAVLPQLARETLRAWRLVKLKLVAGIAAISVAGAFLAVNVAPRPVHSSTPHSASDKSVAAAVQVSESASSPTSNTTATSEVAAKRVIDLHVIETQTKQPLVDADIHVTERFGMTDGERQEMSGHTDPDGRYRIELPENDPPYLSVTAHKDGFVPMRVVWHTLGGTFHLPQEFTLTLEPATSIGGVVEDEQGQPIPGASVFIILRGGNMSDATEEVSVDVWDYKVVTDAQGRWRFDQAPSDLSELRIRLAGPGYLTDTSYGVTPTLYGDTPTPPVEKLRDMTVVMVMRKGLSLAGTVVDDQGAPIANASVAQGSDRNGTTGSPETKTDAQGHFLFGNVRPGQVVLTIQAEGYAPELKMMEVDSQTQPLEIRLAKGFVIRGRVIGHDGKPISAAGVAADTWREHRSLEWRAVTDGEGRFVWSNAPPDEVKFNVFKDGYSRNDRHGMTPSDKEQIVTLQPLLRVRGQVVDADSGQPIMKFDAIPGRSFGAASTATWERYGTIHSTNGQYEVSFDHLPVSINIRRNLANGKEEISTNIVSGVRLVRIEADGYQPATSREFESGETTAVADFKLARAAWIQGVVYSPDHQPLSGADVFLATSHQWLLVENGHVVIKGQFPTVRTGDDGRFKFPPLGNPYLVLALHKQGCGQVVSQPDGTLPDLIIVPWARVEGNVFIGAQVAAAREVGLERDDQPIETAEIEKPWVMFQANATTDGTGHFAMDNIPAGKMRVGVWTPLNGRIGQSVMAQVVHFQTEPGQTSRVTIGSIGQPVIGHLVAPAGFENQIDWAVFSPKVSTVIPPSKFPDLWLVMTQEEKDQWLQVERHSYPMAISADGFFRVEDVPSGTYEVQISLTDPLSNGVSIVQHSFRVEFTVPESPNGRSGEPLNLGDLELTPIASQE